MAAVGGQGQGQGQGLLGSASAAVLGRLLGPDPINMEDLMQLEMTVRGLEELHGQVHPQVRSLIFASPATGWSAL